MTERIYCITEGKFCSSEDTVRMHLGHSLIGERSGREQGFIPEGLQ